MIAACLTGCGKKAEPVSRSSFLLNTFVTVTLYDSEDQEILDGAMKLCSEYEQKLSTTIETSEIYVMNHRQPGERTFTVSEETAEVIEKGLEYSRLSDGVFDITIEPLSSLWNFTGADPHVPSEDAIREELSKVGYENVSVSGNQITFANDVTTIDLGAIAKGYIADRMKEYLKSQCVESAIINLGGNVLFKSLSQTVQRQWLLWISGIFRWYPPGFMSGISRKTASITITFWIRSQDILMKTA